MGTTFTCSSVKALIQTSLLTSIFFLLALVTTSWGQTRIYVRPDDGRSIKDGTSWQTAFDHLQLQKAIDKAQAGQQVWVASGTYKPTAGTNADLSFQMKNGVEMYGGFWGTESTLEQRPAISYENPSTSVLSGEIGDLTKREDNTRHVIMNRYLSASSVLDGFIIRDGYSLDDGAGMYNASSYTTVRNCGFTNNVAKRDGGAICTTNISSNSGYGPDFYNCWFRSNSAKQGGVIAHFSDNSCRFVNSVFIDNTAINGGVVVSFKTVKFNNCTIVNNSATSGGVDYGSCYRDYLNCIIWNNGGANTFYYYAHPALGGCDNYYFDFKIIGTLTNCIVQPEVSSYTNGNIGNIQTEFSPFANLRSGNLYLNTCSKALDAGIPARANHLPAGKTDIAGNPRNQTKAIDIGAFEGFDPSSTSTTPVPPAIISQPLANILCLSDSSARIAVVATGTDLHYQWKKNNLLIGTDSSVLILPKANYQPANVYSVDVIGSCAKVSSQPFSLIGSPVTFTNTGISCQSKTSTLTVLPTGQQYAFSNENNVFKASNIASATSPGTYQVSVRSSNGCTVTAETKVILSSGTSQDIIYVKTGGSGLGCDWSSPLGTLQDALKTAVSGQQIWVAAGTYKPTEDANTSASFEINRGVKVYGGFLGTETSLDQRPAINYNHPSQSILSGNIGNPDDMKDNSRRILHVFPKTDDDENSVFLDGFIIRDGYSENGGPGLYSDRLNTLIRNCWFTNNQSFSEGGSIVSIASTNFEKCWFTNNRSTNSGGAVYCGNNGNFNFYNCLLINNTSEGSGGAIAIADYANLTIYNCTFINNRARLGGATSAVMFSYGFATNCIFWNNGLRNTFYNENGKYGGYIYIDYSFLEMPLADVNNPKHNVFSNDSPFVDIDHGYLQLAQTSPAVNTGSTVQSWNNPSSTDLAGNLRVIGPAIDMGAFELQSQSSLPVTLTQFNAYLLPAPVKVTLNWQTVWQKNTSRFEVQKSYDGQEFFTIGQVFTQSTQETKQTQLYHFEDFTIPLTISVIYYRLKIVDQDTTFTYSHIKAVSLENPAPFLVVASPTTNQSIKLWMTGYELKDLQLTSLSGQLIPTSAFTNSDGSIQLKTDQLLKTGIYILSAGYGVIQKSQRIVIQ
ncbi:T9SS type A sorting domain-containing protein [Siphonobacter sp. SORGH_AS_1065]|uniref:T9SS type A sorting domain-containing protein n=1 Tax=Siphonobacter sp. SORGH_AS_1065 TaxID=3041795 RepID=UPI00278316BB|nr:T9SS type A sorting domain-containing protein [Siphonobacter sp. SORGH_AS_1065]MDQ1088350.1 putative outer membrane repeat protein [Siphonobacter sp. SORGH_AS_1065]